MSITIKCSACGAPVEVPAGGTSSVTCPFCGAANALAPQNLSSAPTIALSRGDLPPGSAGAPRPDKPLPAAPATILAGSAARVQAQFASSAELMDEVKRLLRAGNKIEAVNIHRAYFNTSMQESLTAVEQVEFELRPAAPVRPAALPPQDAVPPAVTPPPAARKGLGGCVWALIAVVLLAGIVCLIAAIVIVAALF